MPYLFLLINRFLVLFLENFIRKCLVLMQRTRRRRVSIRPEHDQLQEGRLQYASLGTSESRDSIHIKSPSRSPSGLVKIVALFHALL